MRLPAYITTVRALLFILLPGILFLAAYLLNNHFETKKSDNLVHRSNGVILHSEKLLSDLKDVETGTRGYLLTGDSNFLQPYLGAEYLVISNVEALENMLAEDTSQLPVLKSLEQLSKMSLSICQAIQQKRNARGFSIETAGEDLRNGKSVMDSLRKIVSGIQQKENTILAERKETLKEHLSSSGNGLIILCAGMLLVLATLLLANLFFNRLRKNDSAAILQHDTQLLFYKKRLDDMLKSIPDPLFAADNEFKIIYYNEAFQKTFGHGKGLLTGENLYEAFPQFKAPAIHQQFIQVNESKEPVSFEMFDDFYERWYDTTIYKNPGGYSVYIKDASVRKRYENELMTAMRFLEETNAMGLIGGWELDVMTGRVKWTTETHHIHETNPETFFPDLKNAIRFYKPGYSRDTITRLVNEGIQTGSEWDCMLQIITLNGKEKWVKAMGKPLVENGEVVKLLGTFQDVNDQKILMDRLTESEERFKAAFHNSPDGICLIDRNLTVVDVNQSLLDITGYSREYLLQNGLESITHPDDIDHDKQVHEQMLNKQIDRWKFKKRYIHQDGHVIEAIAYGSVIKDKDGNITHYLAQMQEIH